jgi:hypothetical protein
MANDDYGSAIAQLSRLESIANLENNLKESPFSMPQDRMRAAGIDPDLWYGLGIVGVWAAIDAFGERKTGKYGQLQRFKNDVAASQDTILSELDDLRSLFAHNFAGVADEKYLKDSRRHCIKLNQPYLLSCGYQFNGDVDERITLGLSHLRHYISKAREILACLNA